MKKAPAAAKAVEKISAASSTGVTIGKIARVDDSGRIYVDYPGNPPGQSAARITASVQRALLGKSGQVGREVLLAFENNDPRRPIIVDAMYSVLDDIMESSGADISLDEIKPEEVVMEGTRVVFNAEEEIELKCGKASIMLTKSGKVLIQGEYISTSAKGTNKIKGGSIQLN